MTGAQLDAVIIGTPDVGGSGSMNQNAQTMHGMGAKETVVLLDGVQLNGMCGNGTTQTVSVVPLTCANSLITRAM